MHPSPEYRETLAFLELKEDREIYMVNLAAVPELQTECLHRHTIHRDHPDGRAFHVAGAGAGGGRTGERVASVRGRSRPTRNAQLDPHKGQHEPCAPMKSSRRKAPSPTRNGLTCRSKRSTALRFKDRLIASPDHPVIKRLRGG